MCQVIAIGIDLAKNVVSVHGQKGQTLPCPFWSNLDAPRLSAPSPG